jgi:hypothetical protein
MPLAKSLTKRIKAQRTPHIIERDHPNSKLSVDNPDYQEPVCCYCEQRFLSEHILWRRTWEHLDNNKENEELWNLSWAHWHCNEKKKNNADDQIRAREMIKKNQRWQENHDFELSSERENKTDQNIQSEIELSTTHFQVTTEYLAEKINRENYSITLEDAIYCIVARCRRKTGHGSQQAVRSYLKELTCSEGSYRREKIDGKNHLIRNNLN